MYTIISKDWLNHLQKESENTKTIRIISPFITYNMVRHLLKNKGSAAIEIITRYNLNDFKNNVSSIKALKTLIEAGGRIKGIKGLHSKVYIFDETSVIISSANFTSGGFFNNHEFGIKSLDSLIIKESLVYFDSLFKIDPHNLNMARIAEWENVLKSCYEKKNGVDRPSRSWSFTYKRYKRE